MNSENEVLLDEYLVEAMRLIAEKNGKSLQEYMEKILLDRCNAPMKR